jgi:hypothetical protein
VTRPGTTTPVEFARKTVTVTGPGQVIDHDVRNFSFVAPNGIAGEYTFTARYLGDAYNDTSDTLFRMRVDPGFNPALLVPIFELLLN